MTVRITVDGKLVLTLPQAADRYGLGIDAMRKAITRADLSNQPEPLDGRTPLYWAADLDREMASRPRRPAEQAQSNGRH